MDTFGAKLKALRIKAGKSQIEAANEIAAQYGDQIRMSQSTISALEQRDTAPRESVLQILADYYHVPASYFYERAPGDQREAAKRWLHFLRTGADHRNPVPYPGDLKPIEPADDERPIDWTDNPKLEN